ncbi:MAG: dihydroxyacetone kinase subunit DhaK [Chloroflexota bacterium]|nr:dihydroxyacetone kinase subunit DhaK [Chloroflexota bacterium]
MTNILNNPLDFKDELIDGYVSAYSRYLERIPDAAGVRIAGGARPGKVSVLVGGGSGHYPLFCGYVGLGMATAAVIGDIFTSPSGEQCYRCTQAIDTGAGVVYAYGRYSGDVMNFSMAQMRAEIDGIDVRQVITTDDVAASPIFDERRGVAGNLYVYKALGASAWRGDDLDTVEAYGLRVNAMTRSFGVAFAGCTLPGKSEPLFTVAPGKMELGMGIHGEPGIEIGAMVTARELARLMVERLLADTPADAPTRAAVLLNGLGATKYEEMFVLYGTIHKLLSAAGIDIYKPLVGEYATSLDMAGCSLTLSWMDADLQALYDARAETPAFTMIGG